MLQGLKSWGPGPSVQFWEVSWGCWSQAHLANHHPSALGNTLKAQDREMQNKK